MVDPSKGIFLRNPDGLSKIIPDRDRRRRAIFNLLAYEAFKFVTGSKLAKPSCVESGLDLPTWSKFVASRLEKDAAGRIYKDDMHRAVNKFFGETVVDKALLDNLKASGVQYARELRFAGKRTSSLVLSLTLRNRSLLHLVYLLYLVIW